MRQRYRLYRRKNGGRYYIHDDVTGKQDSLHTTDRATALRLFHSRGEAQQQPAVNLHIARAYLAASDPQIATRNWQFVMEEMVKLKKGETQHRWQTAIKDKAFDLIRHLPVLETRPENFLRVLETENVSTNVYLRRIHNFALDMTWLPWPVIVKRQWPKVQFKDKRAITWEEHQAIITRELNPERNAFYKLAWHMGASQSDLACLESENIDWEHNVISFARKKTGSIPIMRFDEETAEVLRSLPSDGPLFPYPADKRELARQVYYRFAEGDSTQFSPSFSSCWTFTPTIPRLSGMAQHFKKSIRLAQGRILTLPPARGLQAASRSEPAWTKRLACGLANDEAA